MKNFIFDLYNTLIEVRTDEHCEAAWLPVIDELKKQGVNASWQSLAEQFDKKWAEFNEKAKADGEYDYPECDEVEIFAEIAAAVGGSFTKKQSERALKKMRVGSTQKLRLFDGIPELFEKLKAAGARTYLLSNAQAAFTNDEIKKVGLTDAFDGMLLSSDCRVRKPDRRFFEMLFKKYGLNKNECVMIGDDEHSDGLGAKSCGIAYIKAEGGAAMHEKEILAALEW